MTQSTNITAQLPAAPAPPHTPDDKPIRRSDLMTWGKVILILVSILGSITAFAVKANILSMDVDGLKIITTTHTVQIAEHAKFISDYKKLADDLTKVSDKMDAISVKMEARTNELTMIEARQTAQQERVVLFWSITWPALEARLKRTEDRLDRRER